jgi:hypothetical protein
MAFQVGDEKGRAREVDVAADRIRGIQHHALWQDTERVVGQPDLVVCVEFTQHRQIHLQGDGRFTQYGAGTVHIAQVMAGGLFP